MTNPTIHLPLPTLLLLLGLLLVCFSVSMAAVRNMVKALESQPDGILPMIGSDGSEQSPLHTWDPRFKIIAILFFAFLVVSLKQLSLVMGSLIFTAVIVCFGRLPWSRSLRRILAMNGFLVMFLVIMPFTAAIHPEDSLIIFGSFDDWPLNLRGLELALVIVGKAWTVALLMEPLLATAPLGATLEALSRIGISQRVGELLLIAHRYIHVFFGELQRMRGGMEARGFRAGRRLDTVKDLGNFVGMLLVRSFERTHRVYDAMQARGYSGVMPNHYNFGAKVSDWLKMFSLIGVGIALLLIDRLLGGGV